LLSRYGEGEPTDNCADFYEWIMNGGGTLADSGDHDDDMTEEKTCDSLKFFVFGLGNKTYEHFNAIGRRLNKRLEKLGGSRIGEYGEGDDDDRFFQFT
jgi:NADPH-ferrihemoprotein reductase